MKSSFILYTSYSDQIDLLSDEQAGALLKAVIQYAKDEPIRELDGATLMAFSFIRAQMDVDSQKYEDMCEKRREAGKMGGRPPKANGFSEKAKKANGFSEKQTKAKKPEYEYEYEYDIKRESTLKGTREKFAPPTVDEVKEYATEKGYAIDAEHFVDFYQSKNWMVGKNKMKDWKAAVRNWERQDRQGMATKPKASSFNNFDSRDYDYSELNKKLFSGGRL